MLSANEDLQSLEDAVRTFFRSIKRPQYWAKVSEKAGTHLDRPSGAILQILSAQKDSSCRVQYLAQSLSIEAPSITRKTQELEAAGLLSRVHDKDDKRVTNLSITPQGSELAKRLRKAQGDIIYQAISQWSALDRKDLIRLFKKFSKDFTATTNKDQVKEVE